MNKNITIIDVVHQMRNMMFSWFKITLPKVGMTCLSDVSRLLRDVHASLCKPFLPEKQDMPIKLNLFNTKML